MSQTPDHPARPGSAATSEEQARRRAARVRILGIEHERVGPFGLLGVSPDQCERHAVLAALRLQLAHVDSHPEAESEDAERLRFELKVAAELLLDPNTLEELQAEYRAMSARAQAATTAMELSAPPEKDKANPPAGTAETTAPIINPNAAPTRPATPAPASTRRAEPAAPPPKPIDPATAEIIAALVMSGGWNNVARRRIVSIAGRHGWPMERLTNTLIEIPDILRERIAATPVRSASAHAAARPAPAPAVARATAGRMPVAAPTRSFIGPGEARSDAPTIEEHASARTAMAAMITFVVAAMVTIPFGLYVLSEIASLSLMKQNPVVVAPAPMLSPNTRSGSDPVDFGPEVRSEVARDTIPLSYADSLDQWLELLYASDELTPDLVTRFRDIVDHARVTWVRFDRRSRDRITEVVVSTVYDKGTSREAATTLLDVIDPPGITVSDRHGVWSKTWSRGMLGVLASEAALPASSSSRVEEKLGVGRSPRQANSDAAGVAAFAPAATYVLEAMVATLIGTPGSDDETLNRWIAWRDAATAVVATTERERFMLDALEKILVDAGDLQASERIRRVATLLLREISWPSSVDARRRFLGWFDNPRVSSGDLWIATGFLVANGGIPGLDSTFVLAPNASAEQRVASRNRLGDAWITTRERLAAADTTDLANWIARAERALTQSTSTVTDDAMMQLLVLSRINEAAYLLEIGEVDLAQDIMRESLRDIAETVTENADQGTFVDPDAESSGERRLGAGRDGRFAIEMTKRKQTNDRNAQLELIRDLARGGGDLGNADAGVFVDVVLAGQPAALREAAMEVLETKFLNGPNVLLVLADTLKAASHDTRLSEAIATVTQRRLPDPRSPMWYPQARQALIQHIAFLRGQADQSARMDAMAALLASAYYARGGHALDTVMGPSDPARAARICVNRWRTVAVPMVPINPVPASLRDLDRRLNTRELVYDDPVGSFAAAQLSVLEFAAYVTVAQRPHTRSEVIGIIDGTLAARAGATNILEQIVTVEKAIVRLWIIRLREAQEGIRG